MGVAGVAGVAGLSRFPIPFIYIYFFLFPYERLEKPENPQQPETPSYKCADVCTNFSDDWAICLPNLLNRFNIYSDLSPRGDKFRTVFLCPRGHKINQRNFTFVFSIPALVKRATEIFGLGNFPLSYFNPRPHVEDDHR